MADENKTENTDDITMDVMPGADPVPEDEAGKDFKVDLNFEDTEEEVEFPKEEEVEEVEELKAEEEPQEGTEEAEEEEEAEAVAEEAESGEQESVLAENDGDTQQPDQPVQEGIEEEVPKEPMIPKSRFDEVLQKQKALQKQLQEATKPTEVAQKVEYDFAAKEAEYQEHILNGEVTKATALRAEIRDVERQNMLYEMQERMGQTVQQSTEAVALQNKAIELQKAHPELDETSATYNESLTQEIMDLRDAFIVQGFSGADALDKAAKYILPSNTVTEAAVKEDPVQKQVTQKKKVANTKKKIEAAEKQPPAMKGKNKVEQKVDVSTMSVEEFDALPAETLRRMRGDFG